jgi:hypothetical protein
MAAAGWSLTRDRQLDQVGYDLHFERGGESLLVEAKGIQSPRLAFNMTHSEWSVALERSNYLVFAVTDVLSPTGFEVHAIGQELLMKLRRQAVQYRLVDDRPDAGVPP